MAKAKKPPKAKRKTVKRAAPPSAPVGRPTKYRPEFAAQAKKLAAKGWTAPEIADFLEIERRTVLRWEAEHPEFCRALRVGRAAANKRVEASLYHRAVGYSHDDVQINVIEGVVVPTPVVKHYPPSDGAMKLWLTNREPRKWRDIKSSVLSTPPGQPLEHRHTLGTTETLDEYYRRAQQESESLSEIAAADGDPDLGEGDEGGA